ncbi:nitric oxide-associated protein 1 [Eucyclogobius newberryi]|uniref:nitric oxide-associated protein 1 n=1 Tax=Eucyclogobius newberryi TaxID=166745 RepID=UPI003B5B8616
MFPGLRAFLHGLRACASVAASQRLLLRGTPLCHGRLRSLGTRSQRQSCTVDPRLAEQFVFVDCVELDQDPDQDLAAMVQTPPDLSTPRDPKAPVHRKRRGLEQQLQTLKTMVHQDQDQIQFHDSPSSPSLSPLRAGPSPDPDLSAGFSSVPCSGCGALLQTVEPVVPGFLPPHLFKTLQTQEPDQEKEQGKAKAKSRSSSLCQRCHLLTHHQQILEVTLNQDHFRQVISSRLRSARVLVLLVVDLVDLPDSIIPDLQDLVGSNKQVAVVGTKLDLLPVLSPLDVSSVKKRLQDYIRSLTGFVPISVNLVSAKTGFGIEDLISGLHRVWRHKGDVVLVGSANTGKSTLFNALLESDYNRLLGSQRATESPWPGTTLNLLKFPILNPTPARLLRRQQRLKEEALLLQGPAQGTEERDERSPHGYVSGHVGRTFKTMFRPEVIQFDPDLLAFGEIEDGLMTRPVAEKIKEELAPHHVKDAHWLYDTPGIIKDQDMLKLLTEQEIRSVVPVQALVPRTFVLKPGSSLFVGGLVRIDFINGPKSTWFSVLVSGLVPVHVSSVERANSVYEKHAGEKLLGVPMGGAERMKTFPKLVPMDLQIQGQGYGEAAADIKISSAGWVALTPPPGDIIDVKVWSPEGGAVTVRTPSLLPHVVMLKGARIRKSAAYKTRKLPTKPLCMSSQSGGSKSRRKK